MSGNVVYQSTGLYGRSKLQILNLDDNSVVKSINLDGKYFGEGLTSLNGKFYQLTWLERKLLVYDLETLDIIEEIDYPNSLREGWGITTDEMYLYVSDGSNKIFVMDPNNYSIIRTIEVKANGKKVTRLNELEWIDGEIWANIWYTHYLIRINPETGSVNSWVNLTGLEQANEYNSWTSGDVLNGIAVFSDKLYVTGKNWGHIYQIELDGYTLLSDLPISLV